MFAVFFFSLLHKCSESLGGLQFSENPKGLTNYRLFHTSFSICVYAVAHKSTARLKDYAIVLSSSQVNILITECRGRGAVFPRKTAQTQCHHLSQKGTLACWSICWAPPCVMRFLKKTAKKKRRIYTTRFFSLLAWTATFRSISPQKLSQDSRRLWTCNWLCLGNLTATGCAVGQQLHQFWVLVQRHLGKQQVRTRIGGGVVEG